MEEGILGACFSCYEFYTLLHSTWRGSGFHCAKPNNYEGSNTLLQKVCTDVVVET